MTESIEALLLNGRITSKCTSVEGEAAPTVVAPLVMGSTLPGIVAKGADASPDCPDRVDRIPPVSGLKPISAARKTTDVTMIAL
jgi:hypothetical protein